MSDSDSSQSSASSGYSVAPTTEPTVKLAKIFIIKIDPDTKSIVSALPWDGRNPEDGYSTLLAYGVRIADNTYDAYTPVTAMISQELAKLEKYKNSRMQLPERGFEHLRGIYPSGDSFSYLFGNLEQGRALHPYVTPNVYIPTESLQNLLLEKLMTKTSRYAWRRDNFKIYASTKLNEEGRPESCWYLVNGPDRWDEYSPYIEEVNASEVPLDDACDKTKKYCVLYTFTHGNIQKSLFSREFTRADLRRRIPRSASPLPQGGGKSRRRLKRRFKRKTIKQINKRNKRKTIKRRFKKR